MADPQPEKRSRRRKTKDAEAATEAAEAKQEEAQEAAAEAAEASAAGDEPDAPEADAPEADAPEADEPEADEPEAPEPEAEAEGDEPAETKRSGRRRAAETSSGAQTKAAPAPRDPAGRVEVRAKAKYVRSAPRKARLVMQHIRGKRVADARAILTHTPRAVSSDVLKLLNSAVANAEHNYELDVDDLEVSHAFVDEGPTIKRYRPRALGRATRINKRTSHMTITLTTTREEG